MAQGIDTGSSGAGPRDPEELEASDRATLAEISPLTTMGEVHLTVSDLATSLDYYRRQVGLEVLEEGTGRATLGVAGRSLLVLFEVPGALPALGHTGLYHFALVVPRRADLAGWLAHAAYDRVPLAGVADHFVSEALYLTDPDHHGIEIYWDRPRELWEGQVASRLTTQSLDIDGLLGEIEAPSTEPYRGLPGGTVMGHLHLKVASVAATVEFYQQLMGFGLMAQLGSQAAFLSAGGYHHHLGANTWESAGASAPPSGAAALRHATIMLPDSVERDRVLGRVTAAAMAPDEFEGNPVVRDPSGNALVLAVDGQR